MTQKLWSQRSVLERKIVVFSAPFFVLLLAYLTYQHDPKLYRIIFGLDSEGAYGEWIQFICYGLASIVGFMTFRKLRAMNLKKESGLIALFSLGCLVLALEEISYGQWIFNWESPEIFKEINTQQETNLHNIRDGLNIAAQLHILFMIVGFFGGASWVLKAYIEGLFADLLCVDWHLSSYFFPVFLFYFYYDYIRPSFFIIGNEQELFELILSFGFISLAVSNHRKTLELAP